MLIKEVMRGFSKITCSNTNCNSGLIYFKNPHDMILYSCHVTLNTLRSINITWISNFLCKLFIDWIMEISRSWWYLEIIYPVLACTHIIVVYNSNMLSDSCLYMSDSTVCELYTLSITMCHSGFGETLFLDLLKT